MSTIFSDTSAEAEQKLIDLLRAAPAWRKLRMVDQMNGTVRTLALSGLRTRHPNAHREELHSRFADLLLGPELAAHVKQYALCNGEPMLHEQIDITLLVIDILDELGIPYLVGGSLASALHGVVRTTQDTHIVAEVYPKHVKSLQKKLGDSFYLSTDAIRDAIRNRSSFNLIHLESMFKVDIFIPKRRAFETEQFKRRAQQIVASNPDRTAYIASAEDTILTKLEWYKLGGEISERQWRDVLGVLKVQSGKLDFEYLQYWANQLSVADLLKLAIDKANS